MIFFKIFRKGKGANFKSKKCVAIFFWKNTEREGLIQKFICFGRGGRPSDAVNVLFGNGTPVHVEFEEMTRIRNWKCGETFWTPGAGSAGNFRQVLMEENLKMI